MDTVLPRVCHDKPLQCRQTDGVERCINSSITEQILKNVGIQTAETYRDMKGVFEVLQLGIGPLANDIKHNLLAAKDNGKVRFQFYSGHDTTILPMLGMLDAEDMRWPPYVSHRRQQACLFEMRTIVTNTTATLGVKHLDRTLEDA